MVLVPQFGVREIGHAPLLFETQLAHFFSGQGRFSRPEWWGSQGRTEGKGTSHVEHDG